MSRDSVAVRADAHWALMIEQCCGTSPGLPRARRKAPVLAEPVHRPASAHESSDEREQLRERLAVVDRLLASRRADLLSEQEVERYVALDWLEWHGGSLRLTTVGRNLCVPPSGGMA